MRDTESGAKVSAAAFACVFPSALRSLPGSALWYRGGTDGESYRNRRYKISVYGLIAWGLLCYARAATLS